MPMVDVMDNQVLHNPVDLLQIDHHARVLVHRTANRHRELVVVAVVPGTCSEYLAIAGFVPLWLGQDVTGGKGQSSGHVDARWLVHIHMVNRSSGGLLPGCFGRSAWLAALQP